MTEKRDVWIENMAEQLVTFGADVKFKRALCKPVEVTQERFALAVDEHTTYALTRTKMSNSVLGRLVLAGIRGDTAQSKTVAREILNHQNPDALLLEIAAGLLEPVADDGVIAQDEDGDL